MFTSTFRYELCIHSLQSSSADLLLPAPWCLLWLQGYSDKGMRRVMELLACYKEALGQDDVYRVFQGLAVHARK